MREEEIKKYIDKLNAKEAGETIFLRQISKSVKIARVWEKEPDFNDEIVINVPSHRFFFIINEKGKYVGAVFDMKNDLHWFILKEERKKGYLTKALKESILPYLFYDEDESYEREKQKISIEKGIGEENYKNSKKVAIRLGFKPVNEDETIFELDRDEFDWHEFDDFEINNKTLTEERLLELRKRIHLAYRQLIKVSDELLMAYDEDDGLRELARKLSYFDYKIEDIGWRIKN